MGKRKPPNIGSFRSKSQRENRHNQKEAGTADGRLPRGSIGACEIPANKKRPDGGKENFGRKIG